MATSKLPRLSVGGRNLAISSMGMARSASQMNRYSPCACNMPNFTAAPLPWLLWRSRTCIGSPGARVAMNSSTTAAVRSVEPFSTTSTSAV